MSALSCISASPTTPQGRRPSPPTKIDAVDRLRKKGVPAERSSRSRRFGRSPQATASARAGPQAPASPADIATEFLPPWAEAWRISEPPPSQRRWLHVRLAGGGHSVKNGRTAIAVWSPLKSSGWNSSSPPNGANLAAPDRQVCAQTPRPAPNPLRASDIKVA